jgi:hypothetical protein
VWVTQEGTIKARKEPAHLEFGVWWRDDVVAYYCGFLDEDYKGIAFEYKRAHPRIEFKKWSSKPRLFMVAKLDAVELDGEFKVLLDELMASVKA